MDVSDLLIVVGSNDGITGEKYNVTKIIIHPKYGQDLLDYDYALLQINGKIKLSEKVGICSIMKKCPKPGTQLCTAGYGNTEAGDSNNKLNEGCMTLLSQKKCKSVYKDFGFQWTKRMACLWNKGNTTLCRGDWGDSFLAPNSRTAAFNFAAVASSGICGPNAAPVIVTDLCQAYSWIKEHIHLD